MAKTQTQTQVGQDDFGAAKVTELVTMACMGNVADISDPTLTEKGVYYLSTVKFSGTRGSRGAVTNFMFEPSWFEPGFNPESLNILIEDEDGNEKADGRYFVFGKNIHKVGETSLLTAICGGTDDHRRAFRVELNAARATVGRPLTAEEIVGVLKEFVQNHQEEIGYILTQAREKGERLPNGKFEYRLLPKYDIGSYFEVTTEVVEAQEKRARKNPAKFKLGYELS